MAIHRICLNIEKHRDFIAQNRKDPYTKQIWRAGDEIVICASCKVAFLADTWHSKCPSDICNGTTTLADIPAESFPRQFSRQSTVPKPQPVSNSALKRFTNKSHQSSGRTLLQGCVSIIGIFFLLFTFLGLGNRINQTVVIPNPTQPVQIAALTRQPTILPTAAVIIATRPSVTVTQRPTVSSPTRPIPTNTPKPIVAVLTRQPTILPTATVIIATRPSVTVTQRPTVSSPTRPIPTNTPKSIVIVTPAPVIQVAPVVLSGAAQRIANNRFRFASTEGWQDTGVYANAGQTIRFIFINGQWRISPKSPYTNHEGNLSGGLYAKNPLPGSRSGVLICRFNGPVLAMVEARLSPFTTQVSGTIACRINDDVLSDNSGTLDIEIMVN